MKATVKVSLPEEASGAARSGDLLSGRCVELLKHFELSGTVTQTLSSVKTDGVWCTEVGVSIDLYDCSKEGVCEKLWPALQEAYPSLECAHIHVAGKGDNCCVYDWMRPSVCPANLRRAAAAAALIKKAGGCRCAEGSSEHV
jgi:hypothetical protein